MRRPGGWRHQQISSTQLGAVVVVDVVGDGLPCPGFFDSVGVVGSGVPGVVVGAVVGVWPVASVVVVTEVRDGCDRSARVSVGAGAVVPGGVVAAVVGAGDPVDPSNSVDPVDPVDPVGVRGGAADDAAPVCSVDGAAPAARAAGG